MNLYCFVVVTGGCPVNVGSFPTLNRCRVFITVNVPTNPVGIPADSDCFVLTTKGLAMTAVTLPVDTFDGPRNPVSCPEQACSRPAT